MASDNKSVARSRVFLKKIIGDDKKEKGANFSAPFSST
jgi:hypothetical protein